MNFADWNQGLLLSVVLVIAGGMLLVGASSVRERLLAAGTLSQAIMLAFVVNGVFHGRGDLPLAAIVLAVLFVLWSLLAVNGGNGDEATHENGLAADALSSDALSSGEAMPSRANPPTGVDPRTLEER